MTGFVLKLLLFTFHLEILDGTKRTVRDVFKPYGPEMCRELSQDSPDTFFYTDEDLSCHRVSSNSLLESITVSPSHCPVNYTTTKFLFHRGLDACKGEFGGSENATSESHPDPEIAHKGGLDLIQYSQNITLHQACEGGNLDVVKYILSQGLEDINSCGKQKQTPIMTAARVGQVKVFDYLMGQGCDLSALDIYNNNVLHYACIGGNTEIVKKLIVNNACDIESVGFHGRTAILFAALYGHRDVFELLVKKGCELLVTDIYKDNILHLACHRGHVDIVQYILFHTPVSIESRGDIGRTPVLTAARNGRKRVFDVLVGRACKANAVDDEKNNILHLACKSGHVKMVRHILSLQKVGIESRGFKSWTPLLTAARYGKTEVFYFLVEKGCKVKAVDNEKNNIIHLACMGGHVDIVQHILSLNTVSIESRGFAGRTPVLVGAHYGKTEMFDFLVEKGCNVNVVDIYKNNILHGASSAGCLGIVQHILLLNITSVESRGFKGWTPVLTAARYGKTKVFDFLIGKGCNMTAVDDDKKNILHLACMGGRVEMVRHILQLNIVSIESREGEFGRTPLVLAARSGNKRVFDFLVKQGANITTMDDSKNSILHVACMAGHVEMVSHIISLNMVSIESTGFMGRTPALVAARYGRAKVLDFLVGKGCNINAVDNAKNNVLHLACVHGYIDMTRYIVSLNIVSIDSQGCKGMTPVMAAAMYGKTKVFKVLVGKGCKLNTVLSDGKTNIIHAACMGGSVEMIRHILSLNIVSIESRGAFGRTPLLLAAESGIRRVFDFLVENGGNITAVDDDKNSILHIACLGGHVDMVKYLLSLRVVKGMEKVKNRYGHTPLQVADTKGYAEVANLLKGIK